MYWTRGVWVSVAVATTSASLMSPPHSLAPPVPPFVMLVAALPSSSSRPHVYLDHLYTFSDTNSLWGANYELE